MKNYFKYDNFMASNQFVTVLKHYLKGYNPDYHNYLVILCIGTDRCTGDCLGPLVGYYLQDMNYENIIVYGSLEDPIHAGNLNQAIENIKSLYNTPFIITIDASWSDNDEHEGIIHICDSSINPGSSLGKNLNSIGDISISAVVSTIDSGDSNLRYLVLQNVRLQLIIKLADFIAKQIKQTFKTEHKKIK